MEEYSTPSGKWRGYHLLKAFPAWQLAWWGKEGPVTGERAGRILAQVAHSSQPQAGVLRTACRPRNRGRSRVPAIPQFLVDSHTSPWPLPQAGHQAPMELGRDHAHAAWLLQFSCRFLQSRLLALP